MPVIGTHRRIRPLLALGWRCSDIAAAGGWPPGRASAANLQNLLVDRESVRAATARRIAAAYDTLSMTPGPSAQSRARARAKGWPPPLAWDDETIDDPDARPGTELQLDVDTVWQDMQLGDLAAGRLLRRADRVELIRRWERIGRPLAELERAGWSPQRDRRLESRDELAA